MAEEQRIYCCTHSTNLKGEPGPCTKAFTRAADLKRHEMAHLGDKRHNCPHCDYRSVQKAALELHINAKHLKTKTYFCDCCKREFSDPSSISRHRKSSRHLRQQMRIEMEERLALQGPVQPVPILPKIETLTRPLDERIPLQQLANHNNISTGYLTSRIEANGIPFENPVSQIENSDINFGDWIYETENNDTSEPNWSPPVENNINDDLSTEPWVMRVINPDDPDCYPIAIDENGEMICVKLIPLLKNSPSPADTFFGWLE